MRISRKEMLYLMMACCAVSAAVADDKGPGPSRSVSDASTQQDQNTQPKSRTTGSATTFTPTEQIKADSSVAFPVDI